MGSSRPRASGARRARARASGASWVYHCRSAEEITNRPNGAVPGYLPGENPFLREFADRYKVPENAVLGGPETMYPEYRASMKKSSRPT